MATQSETQILFYLKNLINTPSPSGFTHQLIDQISQQLSQWNCPHQITRKGGILISLPGKDEQNRRMITAHIDTLGAMVKEVKTDGRLRLSKVGGFNWNAVEGAYVTVHTASGKEYRGTILHEKSSIHIHRDCGSLPRDDESMELRLDLPTTSAQESLALGINIGDFISFDPNYEFTASGFIKARHLDDKAAVALLLYLLEESAKYTLPHGVDILISNNEEVGFGGNSSIAKEVVEYVALDMGAVGMGQNSSEMAVSICAKDASGPYHYGLTQQLIQLAKQNQIPHRIDIYSFYGSDASAAVRAGYDLRHALFGPGIDASHALERTHLDALVATYQLLIAYLTSPMAQ